MSLARIQKEHQAKLAAEKAENDRLRVEAEERVGQASEALVNSVNLEVSQVFVNQKRLEKEVKALHTQSTRFAKTSQHWFTLLGNLNDALKELGDFQNWARSMEWDMRNVATALEAVAKKQQDDQRAPAAQPGAKGE